MASNFKDKPEWYIDNEDYSKFIREGEHYLAEPTMAQIQLGTLFEDALGEMDHMISEQKR